MEETKSVDRKTLYDEVWAEPVAVVALRYGLSDVGLAKICRSLAIPLPSRGYWAKVKAGRIMAQAPLPQLPQERADVTNLRRLSAEQISIRETAKKEIASIQRKAPVAIVAAEHPISFHPLVRAALKRLRQRGGWPVDSLLRSAPKEVLNLSVSRTALVRALDFTDRLLKSLTQHGFDFEVDTVHGKTVLRKIETGTRLEFTLTEHIRRTRHEITPAEERARKLYWERSRINSSMSFPNIPMYDYTSTGVLTLQIGRWPSKSWRDTPKKELAERIGEVTAGVVALARETSAKEQEDARRREARAQAQARFEFQLKRRSDEVERLKALEESATNWRRAMQLRGFADAVEKAAIVSRELSAEQAEWLDWVRAKADWLDPLILVSDTILDAPESRRPGY